MYRARYSFTQEERERVVRDVCMEEERDNFIP